MFGPGLVDLLLDIFFQISSVELCGAASGVFLFIYSNKHIELCSLVFMIMPMRICFYLFMHTITLDFFFIVTALSLAVKWVKMCAVVDFVMWFEQKHTHTATEEEGQLSQLIFTSSLEHNTCKEQATHTHINIYRAKC